MKWVFAYFALVFLIALFNKSAHAGKIGPEL
jgi:hypothetical protein